MLSLIHISLSEKELLYYEKLDFQFEDNVTSDEPESICELDPGVFLAVVNVTLSDGTKKVRLYRTEDVYKRQVFMCAFFIRSKSCFRISGLSNHCSGL